MSDKEIVESWDLSEDFDLFATYKVRKVYYPKEDGSRGHSFDIECIEPDSPLDILNRKESSSQYDATGHCVWAGAFLLILCMRRLDDDYPCQNKRIIELGSGTGIGGLAMMLANIDAKPNMMCFTDNDPAVLKTCRRNCELNKLSKKSYSISELSWGEDTSACDNESFDMALATDVLYDVELIGPLFRTVLTLIPIGGVFILSHIPRACYNEGNPPEAVEDLEKYIIDQASKYSLKLETMLRPPTGNETKEDSDLNWCPRSAFTGGAVLVFKRCR